MSNWHPAPLGTCQDPRLRSWVVILIGEGKRIAPPEGQTWTSRQASQALLRERGREFERISLMSRKQMAS